VAISGCIAVAAALSLTAARAGTIDLWFDDSWVALSQRAPLSRALHMGVGAPGFTVVMRWWLGLTNSSIPWAQSFALVPLLFTPFVIFVAARIAGASRAAATLVACLCALSPMLITESARVKQYTWEYAFSAVLLAIAAVVRRDGITMRWTILAACSCVVAVLFSFAMLMPTALLSLVLTVALVHEARAGEHRFDLRRIAAPLAVLAGAGLVVALWAAALLPADPPPALRAHWRIGFLGSEGSLTYTARQSVLLARGFWNAFVFRGSTAVLLVPVAILLWFAVRRWRTAWWLLTAPLLAIALSALEVYPLGSIVQARVDAWLIPWIAVTLALAVTDLFRVPRVRAALERVPQPARIAGLGVVLVLLSVGVTMDAKGYPRTRAERAVAALVRSERAGERTFLAWNDWPVELLLPGPIRIVDDRDSDSQFSVVRDRQPRTLHAEDRDLAARELRTACGHTATIVGVTKESLAAILPSVRCRSQIVGATTNDTGLPHDDVITVSFGGRR